MCKKLEVKKAMLEELDSLMRRLDSDEQDCSMDYVVVGKEDEPATDWKTGEIKLDAEGNPIYRDKYDYVKKDELSDIDKAKVEAIQTIRATLEKLI